MKITYKDHMGSDLTVCNSARISFSKETDWATREGPLSLLEKDIKLINYLAREGHWSPFSHPQISVHIKAPIFVLRQILKSTVGLTWNEISRRYVDYEPEFYTPEEWHGRAKDKKQGSEGVFPKATGDYLYYAAAASCVDAYKDMINEGIAPEQARMVLPLSTYSEGIWTGSLAAFCRVYKLRTSEDAQKETQELIKQLDEIMNKLYPVSWKALKEHG